jgi:dTDP-4-amino-4,6-dideoxygalactose transaminase
VTLGGDRVAMQPSAGTCSPLPFYRPSIGEEEIAAVVETLRSGWLTTGPKTQEFEREFARALGAKFAVAVNSATAGLHLGLDAAGIGSGDEVLVPTLTFTSSAATVIHTGARPRLIDCDSETMNIDVARAEEQCGSRTKAIMPVHFAGHPCPMDEVRELARRRGLLIIEDAAHALPAAYRGETVGSRSRLCVFSFYATKNLTTGEGGMVTTDDAGFEALIRSRRLHGMTRDAWRRYAPDGQWRYDVAYPGFKYNMTDLAAAIGLVQLRRLPELQRLRRALVARYRAALADCGEIDLPVSRPEVEHAWHLFVVRLRCERLTVTRDAVLRELGESGIGASVHFIPLHEHSYYRETLRCRAEDFPNATALSERNLSLPLFPDMRVEDVDRVAAVLRDILARHRR